MCDPTLAHVVQVFLRVIYLSREVKKLNLSACKCIDRFSEKRGVVS